MEKDKCVTFIIFLSSAEDMIFLLTFSERGKERERDQSERETSTCCLRYTPQLELGPTI